MLFWDILLAVKSRKNGELKLVGQGEIQRHGMIVVVVMVVGARW